MISPFTLTQALSAMGVAEVFVGSPTVAGGLLSLGATEGEMRFEAPETANNLTAPELTGGVPHQTTVTLESATITIPLILGDPALWAKISATGSAGGGWTVPQAVQTTTVLLVPRNQLGGGLSYSGTSWSRTAGNGITAGTGSNAIPTNAVWLWRAYLTRGAVPFRYADGGKVIAEVRAVGMVDASKPSGQMVYTIGDPTTKGITGILI